MYVLDQIDADERRAISEALFCFAEHKRGENLISGCKWYVLRDLSHKVEFYAQLTCGKNKLATLEVTELEFRRIMAAMAWAMCDFLGNFPDPLNEERDMAAAHKLEDDLESAWPVLVGMRVARIPRHRPKMPWTWTSEKRYWRFA